MTIAFSPRQVQDSLAASGSLIQAEAIYLGKADGAIQNAVPSFVQAPRVPMDTIAAESVVISRGLARTLVRAFARVVYRAIRPLARPLAWRTRLFLQRDVLEQLGEIRAGQASLLVALQSMEQRSGVTGQSRAVTPLTRASMRPRRKIHQFHAGSATGDAITNSMFLIQRTLRARGYDSEIFVEHLASGLEGRLHRLSALPVNDDHVLLVHHSMGHAGFDRIMASPAPKVMVYHNITPSELLEFNPFMQQAAELGRRQLATWRNHAVVALADSAFNGIELRKLGFPCVRECTVLFDIDALLAKAAKTKQLDAPYTVLFVGREVPSKGQADLVEAFACFFKLYTAKTGRMARLVLAGAGASDAVAYRSDILDRIDRHGLSQHVVLTGALSDEALHDWYSAADLYVSLSRHEGFGVPLIEAMAYAIPVVALRVGAVPATLSGAGVLLETSEPGAVAEAMLKIGLDIPGSAAIVEAQFATLESWRLSRHIPRLMEALYLAGAAIPHEPSPRAALLQGLRVTLTPSTGDNHEISAAFEQALPGSVSGRTTDIQGPLVTVALDGLCPASEASSDLLLATLRCPVSPLPVAIIRELNACFDGVLVSSNHAARAVIESGVTLPIRVVGHGIALPPPSRPRHDSGFTTFLHVSEDLQASGTDLLLGAWARAFRVSDRVQLVIEVPDNARAGFERDLASSRAADPEMASITLQPADWSEAQVLVQPSREDAGIQLTARAIAAGMQVITTGRGDPIIVASGVDEIRLLQHRMRPLALQGAHPHALWAEADIEDLILALREATALPQGTDALPASLESFAPARYADRVINASIDLLLASKPQPPTLGWLSPWNVRCGIAQYSRHLLGAFDRSTARTAVVFADQREQLTDVLPLSGVRVESAFCVGDARSLPGLIDAITAEDPDVLVIQHQAGVLRWEALAELLEHHALTSKHCSSVIAPRCVVVALHNSRDLLKAGSAVRERVSSALSRCSRVLVHSPDDLNLLSNLGVNNAVWLPHGTTSGPAPRMPRILFSGDAPVIGTTGFVLPHKGLQRLIAAIGLLLPSWPGIRLRLVTSRYPDPVSDAELAACEALVRRLGLDANVEWHTEFASNDLMLHRLSSCDLLVMPYAPTLESSSGAVRQALASGVPTLVSDLKLFDDLGDAVERLPSSTPEAIAARIDALLRQPASRAALQGRAQAWLEQHDWSLIAERLQGMLSGLHAERLYKLRCYEADNAMAANGGFTPSGIGHS